MFPTLLPEESVDPNDDLSVGELELDLLSICKLKRVKMYLSKKYNSKEGFCDYAGDWTTLCRDIQLAG